MDETLSLDSIEQYVKDRTLSVKDKEAFTLNFGKYKGKHVLDLISDDPQYLRFAFQKAKYRLSPEIHKFIVDNSFEIKKLIADQELKELEVF